MAELNDILDRAERLLERLEGWLAPQPSPPDWDAAVAFRWRRSGPSAARGGYLQPVAHPHGIRLADLGGIELQKQDLDLNTRQFLAGLPANNALLWGSRGTGKSSLIKALLNEYADQGLRLIEIDRHDLADLPDVVSVLDGRAERFIVFCDDLSFEANDVSYKALKVVLDGSVSASADNVLIYATSNRRHLLPEYMEDNLQAQRVGDEIHQGEAVEEKISLSERFGLWLSFYPFKQDEYLAIVDHWLAQLGVSPGCEDEATRTAALQWALKRGSRSGRSAWQFARDWTGRMGLEGGAR